MPYDKTAKSDEWYTPKWIFDILDCQFDLDVAGPSGVTTFVPAKRTLTIRDDALKVDRTMSPDPKDQGPFVWMNPPYSSGNMNNWIHKFLAHGNGIDNVIPGAKQSGANIYFVIVYVYS
jgi:hypothetical protein